MTGEICMRYLSLVFILAVFTLFSCSVFEKSDESIFNAGLQLMKAGKIGEALKTFQSIEQKYPESPYVNYSLAVYYEKDDYQYEALDKCNKTLSAHPDFLPALYLKSKLLHKMDFFGDAFFNISLFQEKGGDPVEGIVKEIEIYFSAGMMNEAGKVIEREADYLQDDPYYKLYQAEYYTRIGNYSDAFDQLSLLLSEDINNSDLMKRVGDFYHRVGYLDSALFYYNQAINLDNDYFLKADIANNLIEMKYLHRAENLLNTMKSETDTSHIYSYLMSQLYRAQGFNKKGEIAIGDILRKSPNDPSVLAYYAEYVAHSSRISCENYLEVAFDHARIRDYSQSAISGLVNRICRIFKYAGRIGKVGEYANPLSDQIPSDFEAAYHLLFAYSRFGSPDGTGEIINRTLEAAGEIPEYLARVGELFIDMDSLNRAQEMFGRVLEIDKYNFLAIEGVVELYKRRNNISGTLEFLNTFDEFLFYNPRMAALKMKVLEQLGEFEAAKQFAVSYQNIGVMDLSRWEKLIELSKRTGNQDEIEEYYKSMLNYNSDNDDAYTLAGKYYLAKGDFSKVNEMIDKAFDLDSKSVSATILKGDLLKAEGKNKEALESFSLALDIDMFATEAMSSLAEMMIIEGQSLKKALNLASKAAVYDPTTIKHTYIRGLALYSMGSYKQATAPFAAAVRAKPENPVYCYYSGLSNYKADRKDTARKHLKQALEHGLDGDFAVEAKAILKKL
jgi:tetratricopeptide (TPR) repeat protein